MIALGAVKLHPMFRKEVQESVQALVTELPVMERA